jgi:hypothetical protein
VLTSFIIRQGRRGNTAGQVDNRCVKSGKIELSQRKSRYHEVSLSRFG